MVADFGNGRVQHFAADGTATVVAMSGFAKGQVVGSLGVAADASGNMYVTDWDSSRVLKFSAAGKPLETWGKYATVANVLGQPFGIALDKHGDTFIADDTNDQDPGRERNGKVAAIFGHHRYNALKISDGLGKLGVRQVTVGSNGAIYVADTNDFRVQVLSNRGPIGVVGGAAGTPSFLADPMGVALDSHNNLYVTTLANTVMVFSPGGALLRSFGSQGTGPGQFDLPEGIAIDSKDNVYVSDYVGDRVQKFTTDGKLLAVWGGAGSGVTFRYPRGIAVDAAGNVYVTSLNKGRCRKCRRMERRPKYSWFPVLSPPRRAWRSTRPVTSMSPMRTTSTS